MKRSRNRIWMAVGIGLSTLNLSHAAEQDASKVIRPVRGGFSQNLAPLNQAFSEGKASVMQVLGKTLEKSRQDAHRLVDDLVDSDEFPNWLTAMKEKDQTGFARSLEGKSKDLIRAALHSRLDRKLSKLGKEMQSQLRGTSDQALRSSYTAALKDLAREESNLMKASQAAGVHEEDFVAKASKASVQKLEDSSAQAPYIVNNYYGGVRGQRAAYQNGIPGPRMQRTLAAAQQRAWFSNQLAAARWNQGVNRFNQYLYGRNMPSYANPRNRFPAGYYYRPDRVEQVVRRGLWGAAAVASTPFALVASMF